MNAKKLLSAMLAGATVISIASVSVFAGNVAMGTAYNSDGEASEDIVGFTSIISLSSPPARCAAERHSFRRLIIRSKERTNRRS